MADKLDLGPPWKKKEVNLFWKNYPYCLSQNDWSVLSRALAGRSDDMVRNVYFACESYLTSKYKTAAGLFQKISEYQHGLPASSSTTAAHITSSSSSKRNRAVPKRFQNQVGEVSGGKSPLSKQQKASKASSNSSRKSIRAVGTNAKKTPTKPSESDSDLAMSLLALSAGRSSNHSPMGDSQYSRGKTSPSIPPRRLFPNEQGRGKRKRVDPAETSPSPSKTKRSRSSAAKLSAASNNLQSIENDVVVATMEQLNEWRVLETMFLQFTTSHKSRAWAKYEHFYSSIDRAILKDPLVFQRRLRASFPKISEIEQMTAFEWYFMKKRMGIKPRRFSRAFVDSELNKLEEVRSCLRLLQNRVTPTEMDGLDIPSQIPEAYVVGKRVLARFPSKEGPILPGTIYGVNARRGTYRIEFDHDKTGFYTVPDYNVASMEADVKISSEWLMEEKIIMPSAGIADVPMVRDRSSIFATERQRSIANGNDAIPGVQPPTIGLTGDEIEKEPFSEAAPLQQYIKNAMLCASEAASLGDSTSGSDVANALKPLLNEIQRLLLLRKRMLEMQTNLQKEIKHHFLQSRYPNLPLSLRKNYKYVCSVNDEVSRVLECCFKSVATCQRQLKSEEPLVTLDEHHDQIKKQCMKSLVEIKSSTEKQNEGPNPLSEYIGMGILAVRECARRHIRSEHGSIIISKILKAMTTNNETEQFLVDLLQAKILVLYDTLLRS